MRRLVRRAVVKSLRFTRRCVTRLKGHPLARGTEWDWYDPVLWGVALAVPAAVFASRSVMHGRIRLGMLVAATVILVFAGNNVVIGLRKRRRQIIARRIRNGLCLRCGYDVRASSGRCPECEAAATSRADRSKTIAARN